MKSSSHKCTNQPNKHISEEVQMGQNPSFSIGSEQMWERSARFVDLNSELNFVLPEDTPR